MQSNPLSEAFRNFANIECKGSSRLYEFLSLRIAADKEILALAAYAKEGQPVPNLLFGAVHFLLLKGKTHSLKAFYPSIVDKPRNDIEESYVEFRDFCERYKDEIIPLLQSKLVQTNEVRRCAYLYPTFRYISDIVKKPLALIEIGTSAGLQLLWDKYSYSYDSYAKNEIYGDRNAEVHITSEIKGENSPPLQGDLPRVASRIGIDLHPIDLSNDEEYLWLNALIWTEHTQRRDLFEKAADCVNSNSVLLIKGDGVALLPEIAKRISNDHCIGVFHTHVANQMPLEVKIKLLEQVKLIGKNRDIFHIYNNIQDRDLHLDYYINGQETVHTIGKTDGHGSWFTWEL